LKSNKTFKMSPEVFEMLQKLSKKTGDSQGRIIEKLIISMYAKI